MSVQTVNIALPRDLVRAIDTAAKKEYRNRSEFIREAARVYLKDAKEWSEIFGYAKEKAKKAGIQTEADVDALVSSYRSPSK